MTQAAARRLAALVAQVVSAFLESVTRAHWDLVSFFLLRASNDLILSAFVGFS